VNSELKKALPVIIGLLNNPQFVKDVDKMGYQFDAEAILAAVKDLLADAARLAQVKEIYKSDLETFESRLTAQDIAWLQKMKIGL
jgi:hypothetical protein